MSRLETLIVRGDKPAERRWIERIKDGVRSFWNGPIQSSDAALARWLSDAPPVSSNVVVSDATAYGVSAFFAAVAMISSDVASLPLFLFKSLPGGGSTRYESHPLNDLLHDRPNPESTSFAFRQALLLNCLTCGNGYAEIVRNGAGQPVELWNLLPERVVPIRERGILQYRVDGQLILPAANVIHLRGVSPDAVVGLDIVTIAREAIGLSIAATAFGARYFANGSQLGGVLSEGAGLTEAARENLRKAIAARHQGVDNAHKWLMAPSGTTFTSVGNNARDSQLVELREFQIREIARFFRIPSSKLGASEEGLTYANVESRAIEYVQALRPYLVALEQELDAKLIARSERRQQHFEHTIEGLLRADSAARASFLTSLVGAGIVTVNEARARENLPALPGGDVLRGPANAVPVNPARNLAATVAHRDLIADLMRRQVTKLCDRASRFTTPERLAEFAARYDDTDGFIARVAPGVRAWLSTLGRADEADAIAQALAKTHFQDVRRVLSALSKQHAGERFERALAAQIATWRTGRDVARIVDHLLSHGTLPTEQPR